MPQDKLFAAPKDYQGLEDLSDDYDVSAKLLNTPPAVRNKVDAFLAKNPRRRYYDRTGYHRYGPPNNGNG